VIRIEEDLERVYWGWEPTAAGTSLRNMGTAHPGVRVGGYLGCMSGYPQRLRVDLSK
jgi:hypothetical protein